MAFASWYSIHKNLPDAEVTVSPMRGDPKYDLFHWTRKCKVPLIYYVGPNVVPFGEIHQGLVVVPVYAMAVRAFDSGNLGPSNVRSMESSTFVSYENGCGKFNTAEWIHKIRAPFRSARRKFGRISCSVNEVKVLDLWERMHRLFTSI
jgi:hypothetical protein